MVSDFNNTQEMIAKKQRRDRVVIVYDVDTLGQNGTKELPYITAVLAPLWGNADSDGAGARGRRPELKTRKFITIDKSNFTDVMRKIEPQLSLKVKDRLGDDDTRELMVTLRFHELGDFSPISIANQVPVTKQLLELRERLRQAELEGIRKPEIFRMLQQILSNYEDQIRKLQEQKGQ
jgi:type VI secretion system protein ImpB